MTQQPEYEPTFTAPQNVETGALDQIWTPTNVEFLQSWQVGVAPESQQMVWKLEFMLTHRGYKKPFGALWEEGDPPQQTIDAMGYAVEATMRKIDEMLDRQGSRLRPEDLALRENWDVRRQLAGAYRDYRRWSAKRKESTTGKTLYEGAN